MTRIPYGAIAASLKSNKLRAIEKNKQWDDLIAYATMTAFLQLSAVRREEEPQVRILFT